MKMLKSKSWQHETTGTDGNVRQIFFNLYGKAIMAEEVFMSDFSFKETEFSDFFPGEFSMEYFQNIADRIKDDFKPLSDHPELIDLGDFPNRNINHALRQ